MTDRDGESNTSASTPTTQLDTWIDIEHKLLRRKLSLLVPSLYTVTDSNQVIASGSDTLTVPATADRILVVERLYGTAAWQPVMVWDGLSPHIDEYLNWREVGTQAGVVSVKIAPVASAAGTYRIVYVAKPDTLSADSGAGGVLQVPDGCEDIIVELVAARVRIREDDDPTPHRQAAAQTWAEQKRLLRHRYGNHPRPGLRRVRGW